MLALLAGRTASGQLPVKPQVIRTTVTVHEGSALRTALAPDGSKVAIILLGSVHVVDRATGIATVITDPATDPEQYDGAAWSPDGTRLALTRGFPSPALVIVDLATGRRTPVTTRSLSDVSWSSHSGLLALVAHGDSVAVYRYAATVGGRAAQVAVLPPLSMALAVAPDGEHVAYVTPSNPVTYLPTVTSQIQELNLGTGATRVLTAAGGYDGFPAFSPDGRSIAFVSSRSGSRQLWIMARDGSAARPLTSAQEGVEPSPVSWTPDVRAVLYISQGRLHLAPADGGTVTEVPFAATFQVARWSGLRRPSIPNPGTRLRANGIADPELSPDGMSVLFGALGDLWIAPATGGAPRRITMTPMRFEFSPRWSGDGMKVAYLSADPGADPELRVRTLVTGLDTAYTIPARPDAMAWSPDGRRIALAGSNLVGWLDLTDGSMHVSDPQTGWISSIAGWTRQSDSIVFSMGSQHWDSVSIVRTQRFAHMPARDGGTGSPWQPPVAIAVENSSWTWDLGRVAFTQAGVGFWTVVGTGNAPVRIADPSPTAFSWSKDGSRLAYLSGGRFRVLTVGTGRAVSPPIAPSYTVGPIPPSVLIRGASIIDGTGRPPTGPQDVLVRGGRIARIGAAGTVRPGQGTRIVDGAGKTLLPGLIDLHTHFDGASVAGPSPAYLYYGVLSIRDVGSPRTRAVAMKERALSGVAPSPRVFTSAGRLSATNGDPGSSADFRFASNADTASIRLGVEAIAADGSDILKEYSGSDGFSARASAAAHTARLPMTSHRLRPGAAVHGIEGKEHSSLWYGNEWTTPWRDDVIAIAKAAGTCVTPTLALYPAAQLYGRSAAFPIDSSLFTETPVVLFMPPFARQAGRERLRQTRAPERQADWERFFREDLASVWRLHRAGVRIVTGTDTWPEGRALQWELQLLVLAGLTPLEAIRAATYDAAACLGVEDALGSIEVGKIADLVLVDGDPAHRIEDVAGVHMLFLAGRPITRADLVAMMARR
jgi:Tol biopolymer transport system component